MKFSFSKNYFNRIGRLLCSEKKTQSKKHTYILVRQTQRKVRTYEMEWQRQVTVCNTYGW